MLSFGTVKHLLVLDWILLQAGLGIEPSRNDLRSAVGFAARGAHQHRPRLKTKKILGEIPPQVK